MDTSCFFCVNLPQLPLVHDQLLLLPPGSLQRSLSGLGGAAYPALWHPLMPSAGLVSLYRHCASRLSRCESPKSGSLCSSLSPRPGTESSADEMGCCLESRPLMTRVVGNQRPKPFFPPEGLRTCWMKKVLQRVL